MLIRRVFERTTIVIENLARFKHLINIDLVDFLTVDCHGRTKARCYRWAKIYPSIYGGIGLHPEE